MHFFIEKVDVLFPLFKNQDLILVFARSRMPDSVDNPRFDQSLTANTDGLGFFVQRINHPGGEININPFGFQVGPKEIIGVKVFQHVFSRIKLFVNIFSFHKDSPHFF